MSSNNHLPQRPREVAPHSSRDRLVRLISDTERQMIDSTFVSQRLGLTRKEAANLLKEYIGSVA